ncbi:MAG TPA: hypothetical protein VFN61_00410 [Acidimicrobiales bacterium]|nr:hypothetical protein [Acidimicrobiales bacterium]
MIISLSRPLAVETSASGWMVVARRVLAGLWLLDGLLQCQPYMFTAKFASDVLAPSASGQPGWVSGPVLWSARMVGAHPLAVGIVFALAQLLLAVMIFFPRTARLGLYGSIAWAMGVWFFGEGLGGLVSGQGNLLTGFPGAASVYVLVAVVILAAERSRSLASAVVRGGWLLVWCVGGSMTLASSQYLPGAERALFSQSAGNAPAPLSGAVRSVGGLFASSQLVGIALAVVEVLLGLSVLAPPRFWRSSAGAGAVLAGFFWIFGQDLGQLWTGSATDPNTAVPLLLLSFCLARLGYRAHTSRLGRRTLRPQDVPARAAARAADLEAA